MKWFKKHGYDLYDTNDQMNYERHEYQWAFYSRTYICDIISDAIYCYKMNL